MEYIFPHKHTYMYIKYTSVYINILHENSFYILIYEIYHITMYSHLNILWKIDEKEPISCHINKDYCLFIISSSGLFLHEYAF